LASKLVLTNVNGSDDGTRGTANPPVVDLKEPPTLEVRLTGIVEAMELEPVPNCLWKAALALQQELLRRRRARDLN
jgi:hypothetical protein